MRLRRPKQVSVKLAVPFVGEINGVWEPADEERRAAWELYVELVTRVTVVQLAEDEGTLREALTSYYSIFGITRDILRRYGPAIAPRRLDGRLTFGSIAILVLNNVLRPVTSTWHPRLLAYEATRPTGVDPVAFERAWTESGTLRAAMGQVRTTMVDLAQILAEVAQAQLLMDLQLPVSGATPEAAGGGVSGNDVA